MECELSINRGLLEALIDECRRKRLPVRIQRSFRFTEENGTVLETVTIEYPDTDFDFNAVMSRVINQHYNLKDTEQ